MEMLLKTVRELHAVGRNRVMVYCVHRTMNNVSRAYFDLNGVKTFAIDGDSTSGNRYATVK